MSDRNRDIENRLRAIRVQIDHSIDGSQKKQELTEEMQDLENEQKPIQTRMAEDAQVRKNLIQYFIVLFEVDKDRFIKIDTQKLTLLRETFNFIFADNDVELDEILEVSFQQLTIISQEPFYELLSEGLVQFRELAECSLQQLENLSRYDLQKPIVEKDMTIAELVKLYDEDPIHIVCLTCEDLTDYVLENAPGIHPIVLEYAKEEDVDFEDILEALGESDQLLFRHNIGWDEDPYEDMSEGEESWEADCEEEYTEESRSSDGLEYSDDQNNESNEHLKDAIPEQQLYYQMQYGNEGEQLESYGIEFNRHSKTISNAEKVESKIENIPSDQRRIIFSYDRKKYPYPIAIGVSEKKVTGPKVTTALKQMAISGKYEPDHILELADKFNNWAKRHNRQFNFDIVAVKKSIEVGHKRFKPI